MAFPTPRGIRARFAPGWAYLTVPTVPDYSLEVQGNVGGDDGWKPVEKWGTEYPLAMYADPRRTEWRARYKRSGANGEWTTGRVWHPDNFEEDSGGTDPTPPPPTGLSVGDLDVPAGQATATWNGDPRAEFWRVRLHNVPGARWRVARHPEIRFGGLAEGETYSWDVLAVATDADGYEYESEFTSGRFTFGDVEPPPPNPLQPPQGLTVHCITTNSGKAEWHQDPAADDWEVWLDDDRNEAFLTTRTIVAIKDLAPDTWYQVNVVARQGAPDTPGYRESVPATERFKTLADQEKPPPPPPPIGGDLPAPTNLVVRADSPSSITATWTDERPSVSEENFYYATVDGRRWDRINGSQARFEVQAGQAYTVSVFGVFGNRLTGIAQKAATVRGVG